MKQLISKIFNFLFILLELAISTFLYLSSLTVLPPSVPLESGLYFACFIPFMLIIQVVILLTALKDNLWISIGFSLAIGPVFCELVAFLGAHFVW